MMILYKELPLEGEFADATAIRIWSCLAKRKTKIPAGTHSGDDKKLVKSLQDIKDGRENRAKRFKALAALSTGDLNDEALNDQALDDLAQADRLDMDETDSPSDSDFYLTDNDLSDADDEGLLAAAAAAGYQSDPE